MMEFHNIDCMEGMKEYPDNHFDLAIVDPPYGISESAHRNVSRSKLTKTKDYRKTVWDQKVPSKAYFDELFRVSKEQIIWGINYYSHIEVGSGRIFWNKVNGDASFSDGELAYCSLHDSTRMFSFMWSGMRQGLGGDGIRMQGNKKLNEVRIHPCQKPVQLYKWLLRKYAEPGFNILDTHVGSGSSFIAMYEFGCNCVGYEIDKVYFDLASKRIDMIKRELLLELQS